MWASLLAAASVLSPLACAPSRPTGLAAAVLRQPAFTWVRRTADGFRVYFLVGSYAAGRQDSLLGRLPPALAHARALIGAPALGRPMDLFFVDTREQMLRLTGARATGFAEPWSRTVVLVTNRAWRAFERHEIMHVIAVQAWGMPAPDTAWLQEGLAQAADGFCAGYANADLAAALAARHGWLPWDALVTRFRLQPDVRAYLQSAAFTDYLLHRYGPAPLARLWREGTRPDAMLAGRPLVRIEREWREHLKPRVVVGDEVVRRVESTGCG